MRNSLFITLICCFMLIGGIVYGDNSDDRMLVRVYWQKPAELEQLLAWKLDFASEGSIQSGEYADVIITAEELSQIENAGYSYTIKIASLRDLRIDEEYMNYDEVVNEINLYEIFYPDIVKVYDIGDSWAKVYAEGNPNYDPLNEHDIWAVKISDNVEEEEDEAAILVCGMHHAREPITVNMTVEIMRQLADNYASDPEIQRYVDSLEIWLIPILNPNGHHLVITDFDIWWRKNVRDNNGNGNIDDYEGVDLNRNYSFAWELGDNDPPSQVYHGDYPFSEPENQAIRDLCLEQRPVVAHSYHTSGQWIIYPYSWTDDELPPDEETLLEMAYEMAAITGYTPTPGLGYQSHGNMTDWTYVQFGAMSFCSEMATEFIPPGWQLQEIIDLNLPSDYYLMDRTMRSKIEVHVFDAETNEPLVVNIDVLEIPLPDDFPLRQSDPVFGRFDRLLVPADYTVSINTYGYQNQLLDVTVREETPTILNVALERSPLGTLQGVVQDGSYALNPISGATVTLFLDSEIEPEIRTTDENGFYQFESIAEGSYEINVAFDGYDPRTLTVTILGDDVNEFYVALFPVIDFEENNGDFYTQGNSGWEWGQPQESGGPSEAYSGENVWGTDLNGEYNPYSRLYLFTPPYRLTSNTGDYGISFFNWYQTRDGYDGGQVQISTDDGENWMLIHPDDGYPDLVAALGGQPGFTGNSNGWQHLYFDLSEYMNQEVSFRFRFGSTDHSDLGWFIDNFTVYGNDLYSDVKKTTPVSTPSRFMLSQNVPNPFNPKTVISYGLPSTSDVALSIYDLSGRLVRRWTESAKSAGRYSIEWNGKNESGNLVQSGMYFYRLEFGDEVMTRKMLLLR